MFIPEYSSVSVGQLVFKGGFWNGTWLGVSSKMVDTPISVIAEQAHRGLGNMTYYLFKFLTSENHLAVLLPRPIAWTFCNILVKD